MSFEPWQKAEIAGTKKALPLKKPEVVLALLKKAKRPIFIVGHEAAEVDLGNRKLIDYVIDVAKAAGISVVATANVVKEFLKRDFQPIAWMPAVDIANRLRDPDWEGLDDMGAYDLALFGGLPYYMEWLILSGLKHFSTQLMTMALDGFYQPHASWSLGNLSPSDLKEFFETLIMKLGEK